jgi:Ca2+-binding RTX toxin-like protein
VDDGDETDTGTITVHIVDDEPVGIFADSAHIIDGGESLGEMVNFVPGADGIGNLEFNLVLDPADPPMAMDNAGNELTLNGENLYLFYGDDGSGGVDQTVLIAKTLDGDDPDIGFTITIDPATNTYSIDANPIISNGTAITPTDLRGVGGGNYDWKALIDVGGTEQDVMMSTLSPDTVNTNSTQIGISEGNSIEFGEGIRFDFVNGLAVQGSGSSATWSYDDHNLTGVYKQTIDFVGGNPSSRANLTVTAILADADTTFYGDSDEGKLALSALDITVYDENGDPVTPGDQGLTIDDTDPYSVTINGLDEGWTFEVDPDGQFSAIQIDGADDTATFKLGFFTYGESSLGDPIELTYGVTGEDGDGDTTDGDITATIYPAADEAGVGDDVLLGDSGDNTIDGLAGDDVIAGYEGEDDLDGGDGADTLSGGPGDDTLTGGAGDDTLTGGSGADTFVTGEGDDIITFYSQAEGDVVDISGVFDDGAGDYLDVSENADGTVKLSIFDSGHVEKGSVSFESIDYADLETGDELNSLLGQVDVDDGTT